jgi:hypothetical protein
MIAYKDISAETFERIKSENNGFRTEVDREALESELTIVGIFAL